MLGFARAYFPARMSKNQRKLVTQRFEGATRRKLVKIYLNK